MNGLKLYSEVAEKYNEFLAKIGFDCDHPANGTFLPGELFNGPTVPGQKQALHASGHPGYNTAIGDKMKGIAEKFDKDLKKIPIGPDYDKQLAQLISDSRDSVRNLQTFCRDNLQKGAPIVGDTTHITDEWTIRLAQLP